MKHFFLQHTISRLEMFLVAGTVSALNQGYFLVAGALGLATLFASTAATGYMKQLWVELHEVHVDIRDRYMALLNYTGWDDKAVQRQMAIDKVLEAQHDVDDA